MSQSHIKEFQTFINEYKTEMDSTSVDIMNNPDPEFQKIKRFVMDYIWGKTGAEWDSNQKRFITRKENAEMLPSLIESSINDIQRTIDIMKTVLLEEIIYRHNPGYTSNESKSTKSLINEERKQRVDPWNHAEKTVLNMIRRIPADGPYTVTDPRDGTPIAEVNFRDGVLDGAFKFYRGRQGNVQLSVEGQYIKGMKIGTWNLYGLRGNVIQTELF